MPSPYAGRWSGAVLLHDPVGQHSAGRGIVERFTCVEDSEGWSWTGERTDPVTGATRGLLHLQADAGGVVRRLHLESGGWLLRGGCVGTPGVGLHVLWRRGDAEGEQVADGFWGSSPAYALAAVRHLAHGVGLEVGRTQRLRLLAALEPSLALRTVDTAWTRGGEGQWRVDDLGSGERREVRLEDGRVVAGTGWSFTDG